MKRLAFAAAALAAVGLAVATAQDPNPAPPARPAGANPFQNGGRQVQPQPVPGAVPGAAQPDRGAFTRTMTATRMAALEEEFEVLEAHRDVKRAHVRAAEVGVKGAEMLAARAMAAAERGVGGKDEVAKFTLDVEAAKAQLDIRTAEMKEVEVKIKFAKKRLEDAKAAGVRPPPEPRERKPVDPPPPGRN